MCVDCSCLLLLGLLLLLVFVWSLEFQIIRFVISTFTPIFHIYCPIVRWSDGMQCCRSDWPGLCLFVVVNPCVLSANRVDLGFVVL